MIRVLLVTTAFLGIATGSLPLCAEVLPIRGTLDARVRVIPYDADQVYRLHGYVGYQIDLQFEPGEHFAGLGAGDIEGLTFAAQDNHLFLKPKAPSVGTNLTVLTNLRHYHFDYTAVARRPDPFTDEVIYSVRFLYPEKEEDDSSRRRIDASLAEAHAARSQNIDYWFRGHPSLKPIAASDNSIHTRLRFPGNTELPVIFVRNDDNTESLLNFSVDAGDIIIHRVARTLVLRRGKLTACIVNKAFEGTSDRLESGTVAPDVERSTKAPPTNAPVSISVTPP